VSGTNRQKKELFVMTVHSASGDTLPGNLTIIPSAQKWVLHAMYQHAFPHLFSSEVCSWNRLVLTDEDTSQFKPYECLISTTNVFNLSKVMIYTFHRICIQESHLFQLWKVKNRTNPWRDNESNLYKNHLYLIKQMHTNSHNSFHAGDWIYQLFIPQAFVFEIQAQYKKANSILISKGLYEAISQLQLQVNEKQPYLANWVRKSITMSFDAMTTSPVESINCHIKHISKVSDYSF
jgi:hypothetical protein